VRVLTVFAAASLSLTSVTTLVLVATPAVPAVAQEAGPVPAPVPSPAPAPAPAPVPELEHAPVALAAVVIDERLAPALDWPIWDTLALCESGQRWHIQGRRYGGGLQILGSTWRNHGGTEFGALPSHATREQQIVVARRILDSGGWRQWGRCARRLKL
jgi:Transglycosylase-like domain